MGELMIILSLASPVVNAAREKLCSLASTEFLVLWGVRKGIATLISSLANTEELLDRLEANEMNSSNPGTLKNWLEELQAAAYDADDLIESWATEYQQWKMNEQVWKHLPFSLFNPLFVLSKSHSLQKIQKRIDKLIQIGQAYTTILGTRTPMNNRPQETVALPNPVNISREEDEANIVKLLTADEGGSDGGDLSFVHILGMGGLGKTTLAQNVCKVDSVQNYFNNTIIWICVTKNFDLKAIFREILVSQQPADIIHHNVQSLSLNMLQDHTRRILSGKRFLLVLDDLWNHESDYLGQLVAALVLGGKGSKVLVTSRTKEVTSIRGSKPPYYLRCLGENESRSLFEKFAFREYTNARENVRREEFKEYGREIVKKCQGLPLALKHIGALLLRKDLGFWREIAESQTWQLDTVDDQVLPALRLSYNHLSSPFHKQCFAYCSLFPKAYVYEKHELVKLWMAEAIIKPPNNHERTEVIGNRYFKELSDRFFFERIGEQDGTSEDEEGTREDDEAKYKMHDLIHDLAQVISSPFYCQVVKDARDFNKKARHMSLLCDNVDRSTLEIVKNSKKLRTVLLPGHHFTAFTEMQREVFHSLRYVRQLDLSSSTSLTKLPDSIGKLKLLRYLDLSGTEIEKLPDSICKLYNLETLKLLGCRSWLFNLPRNFKNLVKLRHLELENMFWHKVSTLPASMGCLTSLHNLHKFQVDGKTGYKLEELKNMAYLTGALHISKLENAVSSGEANLKGKEMIQQVVYEWTNSDLNLQDDATETKVLEDLEPHPRVLKELKICHYRGTEFPTWIQEGRLQNLVSICLNHCTRIKTLFLGDLPNLRELRLKSMRELEEWQGDTGTTSLIRLNITDCPKLERLPLIFLNLGILKIKNCAALEIIPVGPIMFLTLVGNAVLKHWYEDYVEITKDSKELKICHYRGTEFPTWIQEGRLQNLVSICLNHSDDAPDEVPDLILWFKAKMINVKITNCPKLEALPRNLQPQKLEISGCRSLRTIPDDNHTRRLSFLALDACPDDTLGNMIPSTSSLLSLVISNIPNLLCLPKEPRLPSLEALNIRDCKDLVHLSDQGSRLFEGLTSLHSLSIANCPELMTLPAEGLPTSLRYLSIVSCTKLQSFGPPDVLRRLNSLHDLFIEDCPALQSFPEGGLPTSLLHLAIKQCASLIERCHNEGHNLIQDIPDLEID